MTAPLDPSLVCSCEESAWLRAKVDDAREVLHRAIAHEDPTVAVLRRALEALRGAGRGE